MVPNPITAGGGGGYLVLCKGLPFLNVSEIFCAFVIRSEHRLIASSDHVISNLTAFFSNHNLSQSGARKTILFAELLGHI